MNDKNTYSVDTYLKIIAEKEGITKEEVQQEIGWAVSIALSGKLLKLNVMVLEFPVTPGTVSYTHLTTTL